MTGDVVRTERRDLPTQGPHAPQELFKMGQNTDTSRPSGKIEDREQADWEDLPPESLALPLVCLRSFRYPGKAQSRLGGAGGRRRGRGDYKGLVGRTHLKYAAKHGRLLRGPLVYCLLDAPAEAALADCEDPPPRLMAVLR